MQVTYLDDDLRLSRGACQVEQSQDISLGWGSVDVQRDGDATLVSICLCSHAPCTCTLWACANVPQITRPKMLEDPVLKTIKRHLCHFYCIFWGDDIRSEFQSKLSIKKCCVFLGVFVQVIGATSLYWRRSVLTWLRRFLFNGSQGKGSFGNMKNHHRKFGKWLKGEHPIQNWRKTVT